MLWCDLHTVVETPAYLRAARGVALPGSGKRGGARVVFLFAGEELPVFLLTVFAKNEKADLNARERTALITAAKKMLEEYRRAK